MGLNLSGKAFTIPSKFNIETNGSAERTISEIARGEFSLPSFFRFSKPRLADRLEI